MAQLIDEYKDHLLIDPLPADYVASPKGKPIRTQIQITKDEKIVKVIEYKSGYFRKKEAIKKAFKWIDKHGK